MISPLEISLLLAEHNPFHSDFQLDLFITQRAGGTPWGQYTQALREFAQRWEGIKLDHLTIERLRLDLDDLRVQRCPHFPWTATAARWRRRQALHLVEKRMALEGAERLAVAREREARRFFGQAVALRAAVLRGRELTPALRRELDHEQWVHRARVDAAVDLITRAELSAGTGILLDGLPQQDRDAIIGEIRKDPSALPNWWRSHSFPLPPFEVPELPAPPTVPLRELPA